MTTLGAVVEASPEKVDPAAQPDAAYIGLEHIESGTKRLCGIGKASDVRSAKSVFRAGDILYGKLRPYLKKIFRPDFSGVCSTDILVLRTTAAAEPAFVEYVISTPGFTNFAMANSAGINLPRTSYQKLAGYPILLPPLPEQRRIVARLEALETRSCRAREKLAAVPAQLAQARQSLLAAAFRGDHTGAKYPKRLLRECGKLARGVSKHRPRGDERLFGTEYPFIQTGEVANSGGRIRSATKYYSKFGLNQSRLFPIGTVCVTIAANIGDSAILEIPACFPDSIVGFTPNPTMITSEWTEFYFRVIRAELEAFAPATAQKNINLRVLEEVEIPLPPLPEQQEIVRRLSAAFVKLDAAARAHAAAMAALDLLDQSLLARAFSGEMVPQSTDDEPASETLKRLSGIRAETLKLKKERRPREAASIEPDPNLAMPKSRFDSDVKGQPYLANLLRKISKERTVEELLKRSDLPLVDFYKQLDWEVRNGKILNDTKKLEPVE